jgi:predicted DNA-binding transcriptional regulator AlpA
MSHSASILALEAGRANNPAPLIPVTAVAKRCGCSVATVWRRVKDGALPQPIRLGGITRWEAAEIEAAIAVAKAARNPQIAA